MITRLLKNLIGRKPLTSLDFLAMSTDEKGRWGEEIIFKELHQQRYRLRSVRYEIKDIGEIDLIFSHKTHLLFCEVKVRDHEDPNPWAEALDKERIQRVVQTASHYLRTTRQLPVSIRFDAFVVHLNAEEASWEIERLENYINPRTVPGWYGLTIEEVEEIDRTGRVPRKFLPPAGE